MPNFRNVFFENLNPSSQKKDKDQQQQTTNILCEQGDMGLFGDPLSEADQRKYDQQQSENK